jgi:TRAP transporter TAXI family solute receptor
LADSLEEETARPVSVLETAGSYANREMLQEGKAELALLQSEALTSNALAVATPLYYETVLVVARRRLGLRSVADLRGRAVALGPNGSGMRNTALTILRHYGIEVSEISRSESSFFELLANDDLDAAFVITGYDSPSLQELLASSAVVLLPIDRSLQIAEAEPSLKPTRLAPETVPAFLRNLVPREGLSALKTPAFLTVRSDASPKLVRAALEVIYLESDLVQREGLIPLEQAARWPLLPLHAAAAEFFRETGP